MMWERAGAAKMGPAYISEVLGLPLSTVSHHMRRLREFEAVELSGTERVRGTTKHFYALAHRFRTQEWVIALMNEGLAS